MTGDDAYTLLCALVGGDEDGFVGKFDVDSATAEDVAALIAAQRSENEHLRSQLAAVSNLVTLMRFKRRYVKDAWLRTDLETLDRLAALTLPTIFEDDEVARRLRRLT